MASQLFVAVVLIICCQFLGIHGIPFNLTEDTHDIYQCPDPSAVADSPLCRYQIQESGKFLQTLTKTLKCPESGVNKLKIDCIIVTNEDDNDNGGYSYIQAGGLDQFYVDIYLKSQLSKGLNFQVEIYTAAATTTSTTTTTASSRKLS